MKVNGKMIKQMAKVLINIVMVLFLQAIGKMINKMVSAKKSGLMVQNMKEIIPMVKKMDKENLSFQMAHTI